MKILKSEDISPALSEIKTLNKKIVLVGGCFDILHNGHIEFLKAAKNEGDILVVLLESDENIREKKGKNRPINLIAERISALSKINSVDYIVPLSGVTKNEEYDRLMFLIEPSVVAITKGDINTKTRKKQCELHNIKLREVIERLEGLSTTALINKLE